VLDERFRRFEGSTGFRPVIWLAGPSRRPFADGVEFGVYREKWKFAVVHLDPGFDGLIEHGIGDGHDSSGQVPFIKLINLAFDGHGGVASDSTAVSHGHGLVKRLGFDSKGDASAGSIDGQRTSTEESAVGCNMIMLTEKCFEALIDVRKASDLSKMVEASLPETSPESFHFSAGLRIIGPRVKEADAEPRAGKAKRFAAVSRTIIQIEGVRFSAALQRTDEEVEHIVLALGRVRFERHDVARTIVQEAVNADRGLEPAEGERRAVAHVPVPQRVRQSRLPAETCLGPLSLSGGDSVETLLPIEPSKGGLLEFILLEAAVGLQCSKD
jgi:hypothetical protein